MTDQRVLLSTSQLCKEYDVRGRAPVVAVDNVSLELRSGETLAVVGESGSGKTTLARMMLGLLPPTSGRVEVGGRDVFRLPAAELRALRRDLQVVLQDPFSSMNPRLRVVDIVAEPLVTHEPQLRGRRGRAEREAQVAELLTAVGLEANVASRYPHEFSGGQRQRISIARALALRPEVIVLDEPTSALDVSVQAQVLDLLSSLQREFHLSYVFVSHNLAVVRKLADRVAVMRAGAVVETGPVATVFDSPSDPYTRALLDAVLEPDPRRARRRRTLDVA
ncbi:ATP-binding cassette domain-containing protein [Kribbella italica]|uniref:Oligopeptide transport system ATP-binding protein n=1 Tax=Kribbella italica TaxID=1540520 RepID=A0A7W9JF85_9ACTN|nr:ATP-binding cassette domain-containing protein [Kribbella italica]MBB5840864.1 oligopeptide transport system ATP-binding protein [Kribbella italica]